MNDIQKQIEKEKQELLKQRIQLLGERAIELLQKSFTDYLEQAIGRGSVKIEPNFVPYGDTQVNEGYYPNEEQVDALVDEFKEELQETPKISGFVADYLAEDDKFLDILSKIIGGVRL